VGSLRLKVKVVFLVNVLLLPNVILNFLLQLFSQDIVGMESLLMEEIFGLDAA